MEIFDKLDKMCYNIIYETILHTKKGEIKMRTKKTATMPTLVCDLQDFFLRRHNAPVSIDVMHLGECYMVTVGKYEGAQTASLYRSIRDHIAGKYDLSADQIYVRFM